jgi:DNA-binding XRE family transcriptional regulator
MFVLHRCDRPPCVNPDHLFLGSHQDNMDNMGAKGRRHDRERHPGARLTWEEVRAIRGLDAAGETHGAIANQLGVSRATVGSIVRGNIWDEPTYVPPRARRKGPRPESARTAKLTWGSVKDIRSRLSAGETPMSLATTYGVSRESIYAIRSGDTWKETT